MGTTRSIVEFKHDTGYGDSLLFHINNAISGKDMVALSAMEIPKYRMEDPANWPESTGKFRSLRDLRDELAAKVMPKIKPLVWERGNDLIDEWTAETPFGKFRVFRRPQDEVARIYLSAINNIKHPHIESVEETKAYCEAEYERCVMECLE